MNLWKYQRQYGVLARAPRRLGWKRSGAWFVKGNRGFLLVRAQDNRVYLPEQTNPEAPYATADLSQPWLWHIAQYAGNDQSLG